jgi:hypothetical protein
MTRSGRETTVSDNPTNRPRAGRPPVPPVGAGPTDGADAAKPRTQLIRVAVREGTDTSRVSPRMRFDLLQLLAWVLGVSFVVAGLVAVARAGFDELVLTGPVVEVGGQPATPLLALLWLLVGVALLAAATGEVAERELRVGGVLLGILGAVWAIESAAFAPYLGVERDSGVLLLGVGGALTATSYIPPLSIARPGIPEN